MEPKIIASLIGVGTILTNTALFTTFYRDSKKIEEQNNLARKQIVLTLVQEDYPLANIKNMGISHVEERKDCPRTYSSEPVQADLEQKLIGSYCLTKSIDEAARKWEEGPLPYVYHSARRLD